MDTKTLVHIGTEILVIGGITFYYQKKIGELTAQNTELVKRLDHLEKVLAHHDNALRLILNGPSEPTPEASKKECKNGSCPIPKAPSPPPPEEEFDENELDNELTEEYEKLESERNNSKSAKSSQSTKHSSNAKGAKVEEILD